MSEKILIIDDETDFRRDLSRLLEQEGYDTFTAADAESGLKKAEEVYPDVIFLDIVMPGRSGTEILDELRLSCPGSSIIMITAYGDEEAAVKSFRKGIMDYLPKPLDFDRVLEKVQRIMEAKNSAQKIRIMRRKVNEFSGTSRLIGRSEAMKEIRTDIKQVSSADTTVLISGNSGTGKELVARSIHNHSSSSDEPFLPVNCAGIPEQLLESELFGHEKGAFTGATEERQGYCEAAGHGTLLLDEIGDMPLNLQSKLLRVLEEEAFRPVGSTETRPMNARVIAATNQDLEGMIENDTFREDLYYRIAVYKIQIPSLQERKDDIPLLVDHFVNELNVKMNLNCPGPSDEALDQFMSYDWPGNVRELRNVLERCMILCRNREISVDDLPDKMKGGGEVRESPDRLETAMEMYERQHIRRILEDSDWNKSRAAEKLDIGRTTLYRKMEELGLSSS